MPNKQRATFFFLSERAGAESRDEGGDANWERLVKQNVHMRIDSLMLTTWTVIWWLNYEMPNRRRFYFLETSTQREDLVPVFSAMVPIHLVLETSRLVSGSRPLFKGLCPIWDFMVFRWSLEQKDFWPVKTRETLQKIIQLLVTTRVPQPPYSQSIQLECKVACETVQNSWLSRKKLLKDTLLKRDTNVHLAKTKKISLVSSGNRYKNI